MNNDTQKWLKIQELKERFFSQQVLRKNNYSLLYIHDEYLLTDFDCWIRLIDMRKLITLLILIGILYLLAGGLSRIPFNFTNGIKTPTLPTTSTQNVKVISEESVVIDVVKKVEPSVITVAITPNGRSSSNIDLGPFSGLFGNPNDTTPEATQKEQYIGSGFVLKREGYIVTNKHVVSEAGATYTIIDNDGNKYDVDKIYRDPANDIAIIKTKSTPSGGFKDIELGDSSKLQVGQMAIAIGTPLGEFRNTVTQGVVSGLGRGITAGSPFEGFAERLDNVIQTDAAINPGNSGGPLLNSSGQVIGINTAVSSQGQNIGFAIPINIVKDSLNNFNQTGQFNRPFLGVSYTMISRRAAILNQLPEGAYVQDVVSGSAADKAGIQKGDIITEMDGQKLTDQNGGLANIISKKKVGDTVSMKINRDGKTIDTTATLQQATE